MYKPFRYSNSIEKQLLWYLLTIKFFKKKYEKVLDIGCGKGDNIKLIKFKKYLGIDINKERIYSNKKIFKNKNINFIIHDINKSPYRKDNFDLILFIQVFTNKYFKEEDMQNTFDNLFFNFKDELIFNTSSKTQKYEESIDYFLKKNKIAYKKIPYGINPYLRKLKIPIFSQFISLIYLIWIILNKKLSKEKILYLCKKN